MRNLIVFNMVTIDGYFAGPKGEIDWHVVDDEFNKYAIKMISSTDILLFGRVTYEMMSSYWTSSDAPKQNPKIIVNKMNNLPKIVFSKTIKKANWKNTKLLAEINPQTIKKMKQQKGQNMTILGSGTIVQALTNLHLIDEYLLMVNPLILGKGKPLFANIKDKLILKLLKTTDFKSDNVLLDYLYLP